MLNTGDLEKLATMRMPYGKYQGRILIDIPEDYLLWLNRKGFPEGELGGLLALALDLKIEGTDRLIHPLKRS